MIITRGTQIKYDTQVSINEAVANLNEAKKANLINFYTYESIRDVLYKKIGPIPKESMAEINYKYVLDANLKRWSLLTDNESLFLAESIVKWINHPQIGYDTDLSQFVVLSNDGEPVETPPGNDGEPVETPPVEPAVVPELKKKHWYNFW